MMGEKNLEMTQVIVAPLRYQLIVDFTPCLGIFNAATSPEYIYIITVTMSPGYLFRKLCLSPINTITMLLAA